MQNKPGPTHLTWRQLDARALLRTGLAPFGASGSPFEVVMVCTWFGLARVFLLAGHLL